MSWEDIVKEEISNVALSYIKKDLPKYIKWLEKIAKEHREDSPLDADLINQRCYTIQEGLERILEIIGDER
tara:strand:- start:2057 stop:2269 length:213 start_codon:yes stop_codon:yes gene_type:complete